MEKSTYWRGTATTVLTLLAVTAGAVYLVARATTLGTGWILTLSIPLFVAELAAYAQFSLFAFVAWHAHEKLGDPTNGPTRQRSSARSVTTDLVIDARTHSLDELETTLVGVRGVHGVGTTLVVDRKHRDDAAELTRSLGARYIADARPDEGWIDLLTEVTNTPYIAWLAAGQVPAPDFVEAGCARLADAKVAVWQSAIGLFNSDSFVHVQRGRDEDLVLRSVIAPGLDLFGAAPWHGPGSIVRRQSIELLVGAETSKGTASERLLLLHRAGWTSATDNAPHVRMTAPDDLDDYLRARRTSARAAFGALFGRTNPLWASGLSILQRVSHLTMASLFITGIRQTIVVAVLIATLLTGQLPIDGRLGPIFTLWAVAALTSAIARRRLAGDSMRIGDWTKHGWRTVGADFAALVSLIGRVSVGGHTTATGAHGLRTLGRLRLLTAIVVSLDLALLARGATIAFESALPPFSTVERLLVVGFGLFLLVPMIDVLHLVVARKQRRKTFRLHADLDIHVGDTKARTLDLSTSGVGVLLPFSPAIAAPLDLRLDLPNEAGELEVVDLRGIVRAANRDPSGLVRVGIAFEDLSPRARQALIRFCMTGVSRANQPQEMTEPRGLTIDRPEAHRVHSVRALTAIASVVSIALLFVGPSSASASTTDLATSNIQLVDTTGAGVSGVGLRVFIDDVRRWQPAGETNADGFASFDAALGRKSSVELSWKGARAVIPLGEGTTTVLTARMEVGAADVVALDTGSGWNAHEGDIELLPGRVAIRLRDGSVIKADLAAGHVLDVDTGTQTPSNPVIVSPSTTDTTEPIQASSSTTTSSTTTSTSTTSTTDTSTSTSPLVTSTTVATTTTQAESTTQPTTTTSTTTAAVDNSSSTTIEQKSGETS